MKKMISILLVAILAVSSVCGVCVATNAKPANNTQSASDELYKDSYEVQESSDLYEVVDFKAPDKTVYTLDEIYNSANHDDNGVTDDFFQQIYFDGEGTSITLRNNQTGDTETIEYEYAYCTVGDEKVKCDMNIFFEFIPEMNEILTEGDYTATANVITSDGEYVKHPFTFTLTENE